MRVSFDRSSIPPTLLLNSIAYFVLYNFVSKKKRCLRRCRVLVFAGQGADGQRQTRCRCRSRAGQPRRRNSGTNRNQTFNFLMGSHVYEFFYQLTLLFSLTVSYFRLLKEKPKIVLAICILGGASTNCLHSGPSVWFFLSEFGRRDGRSKMAHICVSCPFKNNKIIMSVVVFYNDTFRRVSN